MDRSREEQLSSTDKVEPLEMTKTELPGKTRRTPQRRSMDVVVEDPLWRLLNEAAGG